MVSKESHGFNSAGFHPMHTIKSLVMAAAVIVIRAINNASLRHSVQFIVEPPLDRVFLSRIVRNMCCNVRGPSEVMVCRKLIRLLQLPYPQSTQSTVSLIFYKALYCYKPFSSLGRRLRWRGQKTLLGIYFCRMWFNDYKEKAPYFMSIGPRFSL